MYLFLNLKNRNDSTILQMKKLRFIDVKTIYPQLTHNYFTRIKKYYLHACCMKVTATEPRFSRQKSQMIFDHHLCTHTDNFNIVISKKNSEILQWLLFLKRIIFPTSSHFLFAWSSLIPSYDSTVISILSNCLTFTYTSSVQSPAEFLAESGLFLSGSFICKIHKHFLSFSYLMESFLYF